MNTLARQAGEDVPEEMTKAEAPVTIEGLRSKTRKAAAEDKPTAKSPRKPKKRS